MATVPTRPIDPLHSGPNNNAGISATDTVMPGAATGGAVPSVIDERISGAPDSARLQQIVDGGAFYQPRVAFMLGHSLTQRLQLRLELSLRHSLEPLDLLNGWEAIYDQAEKRTYHKHGLEFEYAVVKRSEFPYMLHIGSPGMCIQKTFLGIPVEERKIFVMEEFFIDPKIDAETKNKIVELIAVHEYGEAVFWDHHQASLLEFEVARREGFLEKYLKILENKCFLKFRDVSLNRMGNELLDAIKKMGGAEPNDESEEPELPADDPPQTFSASAQNAVALRDAFRWPPNLYDRYHDALDEDEELAREKIEEWAKYIVVNEQARAYFNKAAQAAIDKVGEALKAGVPPESALSAMTAAFYAALYPFYSEVTEGLLPKDYFEPDLLKAGLKEAYEEITIGVAQHIEAKVPPTQRMSTLPAVRGQPLFKRNLDDHFHVLEIVSQWREAFGEPEEGTDESTNNRNEELTNLLWRIAGQQVKSGACADEEDALRQTAKEAENLAVLYRKFGEVGFDTSSPYPELAAKRYEAKLLWALADEVGAHSGDDETSSLQVIIDLLTEKRGVKIDIAALREKYGRALEGYQTKENRPDRLYLNQLNDFYSRTGDVEQRAYVISEAGRLLGPADVAKACRKGKISEALAVAVLQKIGNEGDDFKAFKRRLPILPYLVGKYNLTQDEANSLVKKVFEYDFEIQRLDEGDLFLKEVLGAGSPLESTDEMTDWKLAVGKRVGEKIRPGVSTALPEIYDQPESIEKWRNVLAPQEKEAVRDMPTETFYLERLGGAYANRLSEAYHFIDHVSEKTDQEGLVRRLKEAFFEDLEDLSVFGNFETDPFLLMLAASIDEARRERLVQKVERLKEIDLPATVVDVAWFQRLAGEGEWSFREVVGIYRIVTGSSDETIKDPRLIPLLGLFLRQGLHEVRVYRKLFALAKAGELAALNLLVHDEEKLRQLVSDDELVDSDDESVDFVTGDFDDYAYNPGAAASVEVLARLGNLSALQTVIAASKNRADRRAYLESVITTQTAQMLETYAVDGSQRACEILMDLIEAGGFDYFKPVLADSHDSDWQRSTDDEEVMDFLWRLAPYNPEVETLVNRRLRSIMVDLSFSSNDSYRATEFVRERHLSPEQVARAVHNELTSDTGIIIMNRALLVRFFELTESSTYGPAVRAELRNVKKLRPDFRFLSRAEAQKLPWLYRRLAAFQPDSDRDLPIVELINRTYQYDWSALKELAERSDSDVRARVFVRELRMTDNDWTDLSDHLTPDAGEAFAALAKRGNSTPAAALREIFRGCTDEIDPILLGQLAPYSRWAAGRIAALERERAKQAGRGQKKGPSGQSDSYRDLPIAELINLTHQYDWSALKELEKRSDNDVRARVFVRKIRMTDDDWAGLSDHLTPDAGEAFAALVKRGNSTPVAALRNILPEHAGEIEPILRQLAPYSRWAASKVAELERERAKQAGRGQKKGPPSGFNHSFALLFLRGMHFDNTQRDFFLPSEEPSAVMASPPMADEAILLDSLGDGLLDRRVVPTYVGTPRDDDTTRSEFLNEPIEASVGDAEEVREWSAVEDRPFDSPRAMVEGLAQGRPETTGQGQVTDADEIGGEGVAVEADQEAPDHLAYDGLDGYLTGLVPSAYSRFAMSPTFVAPMLARSAFVMAGL